MNERNEDFQIVDLKSKNKLRPGTKYLEDLRVGDIIFLEPNRNRSKEVYVPADVVILGAQCQCHSHEHGKSCGRCYISTQHLNGDSSIHTKQAHPVLMNRVLPKHLNYRGIMSYMEPTPEICEFKGSFRGKFDQNPDEELEFNSLHFIPRGSVLFQAIAVSCLVVYVGKETKIGQMTHFTGKTKSRSVSDYALDKCFLFIIYIIIGLTVLLAVLFFFIESEIHALFEEAIILSNRLTNWELLYTVFLEISFFIPISLLFSIELLRIWLSNKMMKDPNLNNGMFANPLYTDDLGKISHIVLDGVKIVSKKKMEVKAISTSSGKYKCEVNLMKALLRSNTQEGKMLHELLEAIVLIAYSSNITSDTEFKMNREDLAFADFARKLGYDVESQNERKFTLNNVEHEIKDVISLPVNEDIINGIITSRKEGNKVVWKYIIKGRKDQLVDVQSQPNVLDFSQRGFSTHYFAVGELEEEEQKDYILRYSADDAKRLSIMEKNEKLFGLKPKNMRIIGSVGIRFKANLKSKEFFDDLNTAGIQTWILSQNTVESIKGHSIDSGLIKPDSFEFIDTMEVFQSGKKHRSVENILIDGRILEKNDNNLDRLISHLSSYKRIIFCKMTSYLKGKVVASLVKRRYSTMTTWRKYLLDHIFPFGKRRESVMVVGSSAHDVQMMLEGDVSIYYNSEMESEKFEDANFYGNFSASTLKELKHLILVYGIQNSFSVSKVGYTFSCIYNNFKNMLL